MRTQEVNLNGVAGWTFRAILMGAFLSAGHLSAQDRPSFDGGRFGPPGGDFRGFDRGRDSDRGDRGDRDRRSSYGGDRGGSPGYGPGGSSSAAPTSSATSSSAGRVDRVRVTLQLPASYVDVDFNSDGQIGLYEWRKAKRPLSQFNQIDSNSDGFLTPRELERAASLPTLATNPPATTTPMPTPSGAPTSAPTTIAGAPVQAAVPAAAPTFTSTLSEDDRAKADEAQAKNLFSFLDKNRDGKVSAEEMAGSSRMRPLFEQAGLNFNEPMPVDQFVSNYVRIQKAKRT